MGNQIKNDAGEILVASVGLFDYTGTKLLLGLRAGTGKWNCPGGHLEPGESPLKCALRELYEETGIKPIKVEFMGEETVNFTGNPVKVYSFRARAPLNAKPRIDIDPDNETERWDWVNITNGLPDTYAQKLYNLQDVTLHLLGFVDGPMRKYEIPPLLKYYTKLSKAEGDNTDKYLIHNPDDTSNIPYSYWNLISEGEWALLYADPLSRDVVWRNHARLTRAVAAKKFDDEETARIKASPEEVAKIVPYDPLQALLDSNKPLTMKDYDDYFEYLGNGSYLTGQKSVVPVVLPRNRGGVITSNNANVNHIFSVFSSSTTDGLEDVHDVNPGKWKVAHALTSKMMDPSFLEFHSGTKSGGSPAQQKARAEAVGGLEDAGWNVDAYLASRIQSKPGSPENLTANELGVIWARRNNSSSMKEALAKNKDRIGKYIPYLVSYYQAPIPVDTADQRETLKLAELMMEASESNSRGYLIAGTSNLAKSLDLDNRLDLLNLMYSRISATNDIGHIRDTREDSSSDAVDSFQQSWVVPREIFNVLIQDASKSDGTIVQTTNPVFEHTLDLINDKVKTGVPLDHPAFYSPLRQLGQADEMFSWDDHVEGNVYKPEIAAKINNILESLSALPAKDSMPSFSSLRDANETTFNILLKTHERYRDAPEHQRGIDAVAKIIGNADVENLVDVFSSGAAEKLRDVDYFKNRPDLANAVFDRLNPLNVKKEEGLALTTASQRTSLLDALEHSGAVKHVSDDKCIATVKSILDQDKAEGKTASPSRRSYEFRGETDPLARSIPPEMAHRYMLSPEITPDAAVASASQFGADRVLYFDNDSTTVTDLHNKILRSSLFNPSVVHDPEEHPSLSYERQAVVDGVMSGIQKADPELINSKLKGLTDYVKDRQITDDGSVADGSRVNPSLNRLVSALAHKEHPAIINNFEALYSTNLFGGTDLINASHISKHFQQPNTPLTKERFDSIFSSLSPADKMNLGINLCQSGYLNLGDSVEGSNIKKLFSPETAFEIRKTVGDSRYLGSPLEDEYPLDPAALKGVVNEALSVGPSAGNRPLANALHSLSKTPDGQVFIKDVVDAPPIDEKDIRSRTVQMVLAQSIPNNESEDYRKFVVSLNTPLINAEVVRHNHAILDPSTREQIVRNSLASYIKGDINVERLNDTVQYRGNHYKRDLPLEALKQYNDSLAFSTEFQNRLNSIPRAEEDPDNDDPYEARSRISTALRQHIEEKLPTYIPSDREVDHDEAGQIVHKMVNDIVPWVNEKHNNDRVRGVFDASEALVAASIATHRLAKLKDGADAEALTPEYREALIFKNQNNLNKYTQKLRDAVEELTSPHAILKHHIDTGYRNTIREHNPDLFHSIHTLVRSGVQKLRKIRDIITQKEPQKQSVQPKYLPPGDWSVGRIPNGEISADKIQKYIDTVPPTRVNVSHGVWDGAQRHSAENSKVFQANLSDEMVSKMKAAGVLGTWKNIVKAGATSSHPVTPTTFGWVRYTGDKDTGYFIDEIQTDLGKDYVRLATAQAMEHHNTEDPNDPRVLAMAEKAKQVYPPEHTKLINEIVFPKGGTNILHEAFLQHLRDKGEDDTPVHMMHVDTKKYLSLQRPEDEVPAHLNRTYNEVPAKMGYEPSSYGKLPTQTGSHQGKMRYGSEAAQGAPTWAGKVRKFEE